MGFAYCNYYKVKSTSFMKIKQAFICPNPCRIDGEKTLNCCLPAVSADSKVQPV
jgi:hypothetical protein